MILTVGRFRHFPSTIWMRETVFPFKSAGFIYPHILIHRSGSGTHVGTTRCCRHWSRGEGLLCILSLPHNSKVFILKVFEKFSGLRGKAAYLSPPPPALDLLRPFWGFLSGINPFWSDLPSTSFSADLFVCKRFMFT